MQHGVARQYIARELHGSVEENESTPAVGVVSVPVTDQDPEAATLTFVNTGPTNITISLSQSNAYGVGIFLAANGGNVSMVLHDDYTLPTRRWFAVSAAAGGSLYILRVRRNAEIEQPAAQHGGGIARANQQS